MPKRGVNQKQQFNEPSSHPAHLDLAAQYPGPEKFKLFF